MEVFEGMDLVCNWSIGLGSSWDLDKEARVVSKVGKECSLLG